jgi:SAM-dependent methyltransferase
MKSFLADKRFEGIASGSPQWFRIQRDVILERPLMRHAYDRWYDAMLKDEASVPKKHKGIILELGSGGGYIKEANPKIVTSDVVEGVADKVIDAMKIPYPDSSVRAILLTHTFHHIPDVERFLKEAQRVLVPGGVVSMIEVTSTPFARFFFGRFHPEPHLPKAKGWKFRSKHHMLSANQALSWIVFKRDRARFEERFPKLKIEKTEYLPWIGYLASGGVTRKNIIPDLAAPLFKAADVMAAPLRPLGALHWHITLRKM